MSEELVRTPLGDEPFEKAVRWHLPTMLRWLQSNHNAPRLPDGMLASEVLRIAADRLESLARQALEVPHE